jgi:HPt (histidine-containing phosphotransfer) domain-containing protein
MNKRKWEDSVKNERIIKREFLIDYYQDDEEMIPGILGAVQKDLPALKNQLTHALDSEDKKALQLLSHKLKSSIEMQRIN